MLNTFVQKMRDYNFIVDEDKPTQIEYAHIEQKISILSKASSIGLFFTILSPLGLHFLGLNLIISCFASLFMGLWTGCLMKQTQTLRKIKTNFFNKDNKALVDYFAQPEVMVEVYKIIKENGCATEELLQEYFSRFYESLTDDDDFEEQTAALFDILSLVLEVEHKIAHPHIDTDLFLQHLAEGTLTSENMKNSTETTGISGGNIASIENNKISTTDSTVISSINNRTSDEIVLDKQITLDKPGYLYAK